MDTTAKRARIAAATEKTLVAIGAPVDRELLRYGAETQMADALALLAEDYAKLIASLDRRSLTAKDGYFTTFSRLVQPQIGAYPDLSNSLYRGCFARWYSDLVSAAAPYGTSGPVFAAPRVPRVLELRGLSLAPATP
jgi:hypothetical protein